MKVQRHVTEIFYDATTDLLKVRIHPYGEITVSPDPHTMWANLEGASGFRPNDDNYANLMLFVKQHGGSLRGVITGGKICLYQEYILTVGEISFNKDAVRS